MASASKLKKRAVEAVKLFQEKLNQRLGVRAGLLLILVLGFILRLPDLGRDLWYDEAWSLYGARGVDAVRKIIPNGPELTSATFSHDGGWRGAFWEITHGEAHPPLYHILLRLWIGLLGENNRTLRLLSVCLGMVTLLMMFILGRRLFNEKVGLAAAGVLAVFPFHIQLSQEVRSYALALLLVTVASWAFWSAYQKIGNREEWRYWILYIILASASLYTHYFTASALIAHGLFTLFHLNRLRFALVKPLALVAAGISLLLAPWLLGPYFKNQLLLSLSVPWTREPLQPLVTLKWIAALMCYLLSGYLPGITFKSALGFLLLCLFGVSLVVAIQSIHRSRQGGAAFLFVFLLISLPVIFIVGLAVHMDLPALVLAPRYAFAALIGLSLLFGAGIVLARQRVVSLLMTVAALAVSMQFLVNWHRVNNSPDPTPVFQWVYGNVSSAVAKVSQEA
ncbi:MAG: glycosyltransferase family 39 protein, partial [candidate division WOR-3 bacterium]